MEGKAGAGFSGVQPRREASWPLGLHVTVYQAELSAIRECAAESLRRNVRSRDIRIFSDNQAALKGLASVQTRSCPVKECLEAMNFLGRENKVTLMWVPGHSGVEGNERPDELARQGAEGNFVGQEPVLGYARIELCCGDG
uniref:Ribonuclease H n=1 Tax=Lygus hesperus TaxID=30085 RepID=A0A0A9XYD7_LYGHE